MHVQPLFELMRHDVTFPLYVEVDQIYNLACPAWPIHYLQTHAGAVSAMAVSFSVIVTCYNYKGFVEEAVDGALAQTRAAAQVIVVDDGSTDGSTELLQARYGDDARVTLVCGKNGGQLAAFQRGAAVATGDVLCFLDADDRWAADYLEKIGAVYDERRDVDFVFTDVQLFGDDNRRLSYADRALDLGYTAVSTYALGHWYGGPTSAVSLRRPMALRCLDLPESFLPTWRISADNCLVFGTGVLGGRKYFLPTGSMYYRIHANQGWWSKRTPASDYLNKLRSQCLIEYYAHSIGLSPECLELAKREFLTKPEPTWREAKRYAHIAMKGRASWFTNANRALSILSRVWKRRHDVPVEESQDY
jgi:glycosyltransferase involved in cell wall biosynthesis